MSHEIYLRKPAGRERDDNRTWHAAFLKAFPAFVPEQSDDLATMAELLAEDAGAAAARAE
jgi:hypothetical protein